LTNIAYATILASRTWCLLIISKVKLDSFKITMLRLAIIFLFISSSFHIVLAGEYIGNKVLEILGEDRNGGAFNKFKTQFILDKTLKNPELGIKLTAARDSVSLVTSITITSAGYEMNDIKYKQFDGALPFDISFNDDITSLEQRFSSIRSADDDIKVKFKKDGITVNVFFKTSAKKKITYIKFSQNVGLLGPYRLDGNHEAPVLLAEAAAPVASVKESKNISVKPSNRDVTSLPGAASFTKSAASAPRSNADPFYNGIMNVIESGEEEMFKDIKKSSAPRPNFWNYKYTYSTSVAIPGEKYNMLYSFPFQSSQLDFVSVLEETDAADPAITSKYAEVEAKLKAYFKPSEGWTYHYVINQDDPKGIKDFELKNPKLGSIVLDHSINPYGKHVLYLRFLLQYT
jgi:hypothetical protein